jgi:hypothetical protein
MFTDPLSVTYSGSAKSLPRVSVERHSTRYRTADKEFQISISEAPLYQLRDGRVWRSISLTRTLPDPTPADAFDAMRDIRNTYGVFYSFDPTRAEWSDNLPKLRTALTTLVDSTFESRLFAGEK